MFERSAFDCPRTLHFGGLAQGFFSKSSSCSHLAGVAWKLSSSQIPKILGRTGGRLGIMAHCEHQTATATESAESAKKLDGGWPESAEEQGLLLLVWRHHSK